MTEVANIHAELGLKGNKFTAGIKKAEKQSKKSFSKMTAAASKFSGVLKGLSVAALGYQMIRFAQESVDLYKAQETAVRGLTTTMKKQGAVQQEINDALKIASDLQGKTTFGDEETIAAMNRGIATGADYAEIMGVASLAQDISSDTTKDLATIMEVLGRAIQGDITMLQRYVPSIKQLNAEQKNWVNIKKLLNEQFGGIAAENAKSDTANIERMTNAWNDLKESAGKVILHVTAPGVKELLASFEEMNRVIGETSIETKIRKTKELIAFAKKNLEELGDYDDLGFWDKRKFKGANAQIEKYTRALALLQAKYKEVKEAKEALKPPARPDVDVLMGRFNPDIAPDISDAEFQKHRDAIWAEEFRLMDNWVQANNAVEAERREQYELSRAAFERNIYGPTHAFINEMVAGTHDINTAWKLMLDAMLRELASFLASKAVRKLFEMYDSQYSGGSGGDSGSWIGTLLGGAIGFMIGGPAGIAPGAGMGKEFGGELASVPDSGSGGGGVAGAGDQTVIVKVYADSEVIAEKVLSMQRFNERRGI